MRLFFLIVHIVITLLLMAMILMHKTQEDGFSGDRFSMMKGKRTGSDPMVKLVGILALLFFGFSLINTWIAKEERMKIEKILR